MESKEESKSITQQMNEMYWEQMDSMLDIYKKANPEKFALAQKKGEEIMSFDYNNPQQYIKNREMIEYGKKIYRDVTYNGFGREDLSEYEIECLKMYLGKQDLDDVFSTE